MEPLGEHLFGIASLQPLAVVVAPPTPGCTHIVSLCPYAISGTLTNQFHFQLVDRQRYRHGLRPGVAHSQSVSSSTWSLSVVFSTTSLSISLPSVCEIHATQFLSYPTFLLWFSVPKIQFPLFLLFQDSVIPWNPFQSFVQRLLLGTPSSLVSLLLQYLCLCSIGCVLLLLMYMWI